MWALHVLDAASAGVEQRVRGGRRLLRAAVVVTHSNACAPICRRHCAAGAGMVEAVGAALRRHRSVFGHRGGIQPEQLLQIIGCLTNRTLLLLLLLLMLLLLLVLVLLVLLVLPVLLLLLLVLLLLVLVLLLLLRWRRLHELLRLTVPP